MCIVLSFSYINISYNNLFISTEGSMPTLIFCHPDTDFFQHGNEGTLTSDIQSILPISRASSVILPYSLSFNAWFSICFNRGQSSI